MTLYRDYQPALHPTALAGPYGTSWGASQGEMKDRVITLAIDAVDAGLVLRAPAGLVLREIANEPDITLREVARRINLTERTVYVLLHDLEDAELITVKREGRSNAYEFPASTELMVEGMNKALAWEAPKFGEFAK